MRSLLSVVFIAGLLALTSASPHRRSFGIPIKRRSTLENDGVADLDALRSHLAHVEQKYSREVAVLEEEQPASIPPPFKVENRRGGAEPLTGEGITLWYGTISVGLPAVEYEVAFDTGSADIFLPSSACDSTCDGHVRYNPQASSLAVDVNQNFQVQYADGSSATGKVYTDTVTVDGFVAQNQAICAALQYSSSLQLPKFVPDGLLGMAFSNVSALKADSFIQTLIAEGQLPNPVFSFNLASSNPELYLGGIDQSLYTGPITYTPVTQQAYWKINIDSINANGQATNEGASAIVDTGTTYIVGDAEHVSQFYGALNAKSIGGGFYTMPCSYMPDVSITIQGKRFPIPATTFNLGWYDSSRTECVGAIVAGNVIDWVLGDALLRNLQTVVFDVGNARVGFADPA